MLFWSFPWLKAKHFKDLLVCHAKLDMTMNLFNGFYHRECVIDHFQEWLTSIGSLGRSSQSLGTSFYQHFSFFLLLISRILPFAKTSHLFNSWNENKPVKIGRDGQVIVSIRLTLEYSSIIRFRRLNHVVLKHYVVYFHRIHRLISWQLHEKRKIIENDLHRDLNHVHQSRFVFRQHYLSIARHPRRSSSNVKYPKNILVIHHLRQRLLLNIDQTMMFVHIIHLHVTNVDHLPTIMIVIGQTWLFIY